MNIYKYTLSELKKMDIEELSVKLKDVIKSFNDVYTTYKPKHLFINFEGLDASGKETQTKLLSKILNELSISNLLFDYPNYKSEDLEMNILKKMLNGEFGSMTNIHPLIRMNLYAIDRYNQKQELVDSINKNSITIVDRYNLSNVYNILDYDLEHYINHTMDIEFNILTMPIPDIVFYLDSSFSFINENIKNRSKEKSLDEYEKKLNFQKNIKNRYNKTFNYIKNDSKNYYSNCYIKTIKCYTNDYIIENKEDKDEKTLIKESQLPIEAISILILQELSKYIKIKDELKIL